MGDEGYFDWRATVEIHQWESEQQVQALLQETRRLREENDVLHIQVSSSSPPCSRQPRSQWVNSRQNEEATYPGNAEFPSNESERMLEQRSPLAYHTQQDESSDSTRVSTKRKRDKKSQLSDTMRARLGPQIPNMRGGGGGEPHETTARGAYPGPSAAPVITDWLPHPPVQQRVGSFASKGPLGSVSRRLDDMFSTPFTPDIINYEPPRGFIVQNSLCTVNLVIHSTISCITGSSWPLT